MYASQRQDTLTHSHTHNHLCIPRVMLFAQHVYSVVIERNGNAFRWCDIHCVSSIIIISNGHLKVSLVPLLFSVHLCPLGSLTFENDTSRFFTVVVHRTLTIQFVHRTDLHKLIQSTFLQHSRKINQQTSQNTAFNGIFFIDSISNHHFQWKTCEKKAIAFESIWLHSTNMMLHFSNEWKKNR